MAPTICDDDMEACGYQNRLLRNQSVINYVGRQSGRENQRRPTYRDDDRLRRDRELPRLSECRTIIKRERHVLYESDTSSDSCSSPMTFHNYAKRLKFSESDDDSDKYISSSSDSNENSVSSTISDDDLNSENVRIPPRRYLLPANPLAPFSPVSSTTGAMYCRSSKATPRHTNPYYQRDLMDIAKKTIALLHRNRSLHARLNQLKQETNAFVSSVMANPENAKLNESEPPADKTSEKPKILTIKNQ